MKILKNSIAALILLSVVATGCKNEKSVDELPLVTHEVEESPVQVVIDMVVEKDDILEIFYTEDGSSDFGPKSVRTDVMGKPESQRIVFEMPDDAKLRNLRFDVGQNPDQGEMTVNRIIIKENDKEVEINGADFFKYFNLTDFTKVTTGSSFRTEKVNDVYDPFLYGTGSLVELLSGFDK